MNSSVTPGPASDGGRALNGPEISGARHAAFLTKAAAALASQRDAQGAARTLLKLIGEVFPGRAWLVAWDAEASVARWLPAGASGPVALEPAGHGGGPLWVALREGRECLTLPGRAGRQGGASRAYLPLAAAGQTIGCLLLQGSRADFSVEALSALRGLMPVAGLALRGALLRQALESRVEDRTSEIALLYDISRSLGFVLSAEDLFELVASSLRRALPHDLCALTLFLQEETRTSARLWIPVSREAVRRLERLQRDEARRMECRIPRRSDLNMVGPDARGGGAPLAPHDLASVAHAPLGARGGLMGILSVASRDRDSFGEGELRLLRSVAGQASLTLDRLRTASEVESSKLSCMLESMTEGVLLLDAGGRVVLSNPAARHYLEAIQGGRMPRTLTRLGGTPLAPLMAGDGARTLEAEAPEAGRIFSATCSPVRAANVGVQGLVMVISDVTEERRRQVLASQTDKLSALGQMISGVAHELNNPLASVMVLAQRLQEMPLQEDVRRRLAIIDNEAGRCREIVQDLLIFSRKRTPDRKPLDLNSVIVSVLKLLGHQLEMEKVKVRRRLEPSLPLVLGDFNLLQRVFRNLVHNAVQAMKERGKPAVLTIVTRRKAHGVVAEVQDNGPGIAPQNLRRIFDPFFSTKEVGKGTGLGLSLAFVTVKGHGGTITARSEPGSGAVFVVDLPAMSAGDAAKARARIRKEAPAAAPRVTLQNKRVLVVEDEAPLAEVIAEVLRSQGMIVETAADGRTARARIAAAGYDLIISDMKMPRMSGRELYRQVSSLRPDLARRIIFSTGDTASEETQAFFEEVGNPYLSKPFQLDELLRLVRKVLSAPARRA